MTDLREIVGRMYLRHGTRLAELRKAPVLGRLAHYVSHRLLPGDYRVWRQVESGAAAGLWLKVNPRTAEQLCKGHAEPAIQKLLAEHLRPGMVFYDAGANIGFFSLLAARLVGETGRVFAFEPDPDIAARLRENARRNAFSWLTSVEAAVYSRGGAIQFERASQLDSPDRGTGRVTQAQRGANGNTPPGDATVNALTLDDFVQDHAQPDMLKIDVEGAEVEALRGARQLLHQRHPLILCELHSAECDAGVRAILAQVGYTVSQLDTNHIFAAPRRD